MLYVALGDGGARDDPLNTAQRPDTLLGEILRINVLVGDDDPKGMSCRATTPSWTMCRSGAARIWAFGLRNPWKFSFDDFGLGGTGAMLIGDVGQNAYEEVSYQPPGAGGRNYGWRVREGGHPTSSRPGRRIAAGRSSPVRLHRRPLDHRWVRVSRQLARSGLSRALFLRRFRVRARLVDLVGSGQGGEVTCPSPPTHAAWRIRRHRQHQRVRPRRRGRVIHRQLLVRADSEGRHSHVTAQSNRPTSTAMASQTSCGSTPATRTTYTWLMDGTSIVVAWPVARRPSVAGGRDRRPQR